MNSAPDRKRKPLKVKTGTQSVETIILLFSALHSGPHPFLPMVFGLKFHPTTPLVRMYLDKIALDTTDDQVQLTPTTSSSGTLATDSSAEFASSDLEIPKELIEPSPLERWRAQGR